MNGTITPTDPSTPDNLLEQDDCEVGIDEIVDNHDPISVFFVLRKYSRSGNRPVRTQRFRRRLVKTPSKDHSCNICGAHDHWARDHHSHQPNQNRFNRPPPTRSHYIHDNTRPLAPPFRSIRRLLTPSKIYRRTLVPYYRRPPTKYNTKRYLTLCTTHHFLLTATPRPALFTTKTCKRSFTPHGASSRPRTPLLAVVHIVT